MQPKNCSFALGHLNQQLLNNRIGPCYRCSEKLGDYGEQFMSEIMNSEAAKQHRKTLQSGQWPPGCGSCRDYEEKGLPSTRTRGLQDYDVHKLLKNYNPETGDVTKVISIELRFGNECNLSCRHCNAVHSSKWEALIKRDNDLLRRIHREPEKMGGRIKDGYFEDVLQNIVPGLQQIIFSGGETLYQKKHYEFLDAIPAETARQIELLYVTNGTVRTLPGWDLMALWRKFRRVDVLVSTDGVKEQFEYFRVGAKWDVVESNMRYWHSQGVLVKSEITCSAYQMFYLIDTLEYLYENKVSPTIGCGIVQYPPVLNPRIIRQDLKQAIKNEWDAHLLTIQDPKKLKVFKEVGQHLVDYMMGDALDIYSLPNGKTPEWADFEQTTREMDELFKTDIAMAFPRIAKHFGVKKQIQSQL